MLYFSAGVKQLPVPDTDLVVKKNWGVYAMDTLPELLLCFDSINRYSRKGMQLAGAMIPGTFIRLEAELPSL